MTFSDRLNSLESEYQWVSAMTDISGKAEAFLNAYVAAFEAFDATRIAGFYHYPCLTMRGDGQVVTFATKDAVADFFASVIETYRSDGMTTFVFSEMEATALGSGAASLTCRWRMLREDGSLIRTWRQSYVVACSNDEWTILSSVFHQ